MRHSQRFSPQRPLTESEAAEMARDVLEMACSTWRETHGASAGYRRRYARRHSITWRWLAMPPMFHRFAAYPEYSIIAACLLVCLGGVSRHLFF